MIAMRVDMKRLAPKVDFHLDCHDSDILLTVAIVLLALTGGILLSFHAILMCIETSQMFSYRIISRVLAAMLVGTVGGILYRHYYWQAIGTQRSMYIIALSSGLGTLGSWFLLSHGYGISFAYVFGLAVSFSITMSYCLVLEVVNQVCYRSLAVWLGLSCAGFGFSHSLSMHWTVAWILEHGLLSYFGYWSCIITGTMLVVAIIFYRLDLALIASNRQQAILAKQTAQEQEWSLVRHTMQKVQQTIHPPEILNSYSMGEILRGDSKYNYYVLTMPLLLVTITVGGFLYQAPTIIARLTMISFMDVANIFKVVGLLSILLGLVWCVMGEKFGKERQLLSNLMLSGLAFAYLAGNFQTILELKLILIVLSSCYGSSLYLTISLLREKFTAQNYFQLLTVVLLSMTVLTWISAGLLQTQVRLASKYLAYFYGFSLLSLLGLICLLEIKEYVLMQEKLFVRKIA